jgi:hypothetical protein
MRVSGIVIANTLSHDGTSCFMHITQGYTQRYDVSAYLKVVAIRCTHRQSIYFGGRDWRLAYYDDCETNTGCCRAWPGACGGGQAGDGR